MRLLSSAGFLVVATCLASPAESRWQPSDKPSQIECRFGPIDHSIGGVNWKLYACADGESIAFLREEGDAERPLIVVLLVEGRRVTVQRFGDSSDVVGECARYARGLDRGEVARLYDLASL